MKKFLGLFVVMAMMGSAWAAEKTPVRFLAMEYSGRTRPYWKEIETAFEKAYPEIDLQVEVSAWNDGHAKLTTMLAGGRPPDLANVATTWLKEYVAAHKAEPFDDFVSAEFRGRFLAKPDLLGAMSEGGKLYGLPIAVSARALYYNQELFHQAGVQPPKNWDDLAITAKKLQSPDHDGLGLSLNYEEGHTYFTYFLWAAGGDVLSADGKHCTLDSPEATEALQFLVDLHRTQKVTNGSPTTASREDLQKRFQSGQLAMLITGPWFWKMLDEKSPDVKYGIAPIPGQKRQDVLAVYDSLVMFQDTRRDAVRKKAVKTFLEFMYRTENRVQFDRLEGMLPELQAVGDALSQPGQPKAEVWKSYMEVLPKGRFQIDHPKADGIFHEMVSACQEALLGKKSPKEALAGATERINKLLQQ